MDKATLDRVYVELAGRVQAGEGFAIDDESSAFLSRDAGSERATVLRAVVLMRTDRAGGAAELLQRYVDEHDPSAVVLTNLAKAQASEGLDDDALATMKLSLAKDPNHDNAVHWWAALLRTKRGPDAAAAELTSLAASGSWRASVVLAEHCYEEAPARARSLLEAAQEANPEDAAVAAAVARAAFDAGQSRDVVELLAGHDPAVHGLLSGALLAASLLATGDLAAARAKVAACRRVGAHPAVDAVAADLARMGTDDGSAGASLAAVSLFAPLSVQALEGASVWALPRATVKRGVAVYAMPPSGAAAVQEAEPGERALVLRGAAFGLAGAIRRRGVPAYVVVPVVPGRGPAAGLELTLDEVLGLLPPDHVPAALLRLERRAGSGITLKLFDVNKRTESEQQVELPGGAGGDEELWAAAQKDLFELLSKARIRLSSTKPERLTQTWLKMLGASLPAFLASADVVDPALVKNVGALIDQAIAAPDAGPVPEASLALATSLFVLGERVLGEQSKLHGTAARKEALVKALSHKQAPRGAARLLALVRAMK